MDRIPDLARRRRAPWPRSSRPVRGRSLRQGPPGRDAQTGAGAADRRGDRDGAEQETGLLRAPRRRGRGALRDLAERPRTGGAAGGGAARRRRGGDRRRAGLLPGRRRGLAELQLPRDARAAGGRRGPDGAARGAPHPAPRRGPLRAAEAAGATGAAEDDRRRHRRRRRGAARPARRAGAARVGRDRGLGVRPGAGPPRGAGDRAGAAGPGGAAGDRGDRGDPRRRQPRRPLGVLRRDLVPDRGDAAGAGGERGRARARLDPDRRRRRDLPARPRPTRPRPWCRSTAARRGATWGGWR